MAFAFDPAPDYRAGSLYLGIDETGREIGMTTKRHAVTVGGARSGKGVALIIPNLVRWGESAVVIDPKGENAEATALVREHMGQRVGVLDPMQICAPELVPDRLRVSLNPLSTIDAPSLTADADIKVIADGLVKRSNPHHAEWDDGAAAMLAGVMQFVLVDAPPEKRTLSAVRAVLNQPKEVLYEDAQRMLDCGPLAKAAGVMLMAALESADKSMERDFLNSARRHTGWIDEGPFAAMLSSTSFDLSDLKTRPTTLYLVVPPQYLDTQGAFLRLFVRCAINAMAKGRKGQRCLFLLDEFPALGKIDLIKRDAGLMPGYGVHLWPFLQDLGQLHDLYGPTGSETFFGNADAHVFFCHADQLTPEYVSRKIGNLTVDEVGTAFEPSPPIERRRVISYAERLATGRQTEIPDRHIATMTPSTVTELLFGNPKKLAETDEELKKRWAMEDDEKERAQMHRDARRKAEHEHAMRKVGTPRLTPQQVAALTGMGDGDMVARSAIVFGKQGKVHNIRMRPWFEDHNAEAKILLARDIERRHRETAKRRAAQMAEMERRLADLKIRRAAAEAELERVQIEAANLGGLCCNGPSTGPGAPYKQAG